MTHNTHKVIITAHINFFGTLIFYYVLRFHTASKFSTALPRETIILISSYTISSKQEIYDIIFDSIKYLNKW